jgi:4-amino-4-deoxy-L-arabinose transferase-like glycosyltransferase
LKKKGNIAPKFNQKTKTMKKMSLAWLFTLVWIAAMLLPRLATKGLFGDGLLYASMARNLAEGRGEFWSPFFSSGYWIENMPATYFENPPAFLWFESLFFRLFGDFWWVEKFVSLVITILNAGLIVQIWRAANQFLGEKMNLGWLPLLGWYVIPRVLWGNPNNLMDNFQLIFCLAGVLFFLKYLTTRNGYYLTAIGISCFFGILAKGPVSLYLWTIPTLFWLFFKEKTRFVDILNQTKRIVAVSMAAFLGLLLVSSAARNFFDNYWTQRLSAVFSSERSDSNLSGFGKLEILQTLALEIAPLVGLLLIFYFFNQYLASKIDASRNLFFQKKYLKMAGFFAALGLAGSIPIVASAKQSGIYLLPSLPMFALAWAFASRHFFEKTIENALFLLKIRPFIGFLTVGIFIGMCFNIAQIFGKPGREKAILNDLDFLKKQIPDGSRVAVCPNTMGNFTMHTYLQRFAKIELTTAEDAPFFLLENARATCQPNSFFIENGEKGGCFRVFFRKN